MARVDHSFLPQDSDVTPERNARSGVSPSQPQA